jgi:hypothetical protein
MREGENAKLLAAHHAGMLCHEGMCEVLCATSALRGSLTLYRNGNKRS